MPEQLVRGIANWLVSGQQRSKGRITCPAHQVSGTYADGFAALVFSLLGWEGPRDLALDVSLRRSAESEFDSLAHALLLRVSPESLAPSRQEALRRKPLYRGESVVSNNWALFRGLTKLLRGESSSREDERLGLQLDSGLFPDSPVGLASPTCYHAKICAVLALRVVLCNEENLKARLHSGLKALFQLITPQGFVVPYGRSRNTLFGSASAFLALRLGASIFAEPTFAWAAQAVLDCLRRFQHEDGHMPAVLNDQEWLRRDWDIYINNPDYNAFAAACLLLGWRLAPHIPDPLPPGEECTDLGPVLACRRASGYFACATSGEFAPFASPFFCDTRYAGLVPLIFDDGHHCQRYDEDYCWDGRDHTRSCLVDPRVSSWIAYVQRGRRRYWVRNYGQIVWRLEGEKLVLTGEGIPVCSVPVPRWRRFLAGRLKRGPVAQTSDRKLSQRLKTELSVDFKRGQIRSDSCFGDARFELRQGRLEAPLCTR